MNNSEFLLGADVSHHNYGIINPSQLDFVWLKATEGMTYIDDKMNDYLCNIADSNNEPFIGFYHYARPENNSPQEEAEHFLKTISPHIGNCMLALDWEGNSLRYPQEWILEWLNIVHEKTGTKPLIYVQSSATKNLNKVAKAGYGLWVAHYTKKDRPTIYNWSDYKFWQFTSSPFDINIFKGNKSDLVRLIKSI